jgi:hypothetical protein
MRKQIHKYIKSVLAASLLLAASACNPDDVESLSFNVRTEGEVTTIKTDEEIHFLIDGNADYITFYSGEDGSNYDRMNRTETEIASLTLSCSFKQQYNDLNYLNKEIVHAYISTDFSGTYTPEELNKATWKPISGKANGYLPMPVPTSASAVETSGTIDLSQFTDINQNFYVAYQYNAQGRDEIPAANGNGKYTNRPRVDITGLKLQKTTSDGQVINITDAIKDWAFRPVFVQSSTKTNYQVSDNSLLFQPQKATPGANGKEPDEVVWMVSQNINPRSVEPDKGTAIQSVEARLNKYSYSYRKPGTYTATFVAKNANMWECQTTVRQITIVVQEP